MSAPIDEIKARLAAAPGDWRVSEKRSSGKLVIDANECVVAEASRPEDARDIAQMHADRAVLLAEVERLEALFQQTHGVHSGWVAEGQRLVEENKRLTSALKTAIAHGRLCDLPDCCDAMNDLSEVVAEISATVRASSKAPADEGAVKP